MSSLRTLSFPAVPKSQNKKPVHFRSGQSINSVKAVQSDPEDYEVRICGTK